MFEADPSNLAIADLADLNPETLPGNTKHNQQFRYVDLSSADRGNVSWNHIESTSFAEAPSRARRVVKNGDSLFGTVRPYLQSHGFVPDGQQGPLVASTGFCVIRAKIGISDPGYLFHSIMGLSVYEQANRHAIGSSYPAVTDKDVAAFRIYAPPLPHQTKIAEILDTLDEAIRGTGAVVAKLAAMKQGLLHDLLTRGIDQNGDLRPPYTEAPRLYHQTPLGWLPKGWDFAALGSQLSEPPKNGFSPQDAGRDTGIRMLGLGCLTVQGFRPRQLKNAPASLAEHPALLSDGDLLISRSNTMELVGLAGTFRCVGAPCIYPDLMIRLRPVRRHIAEFLELILRSSRTRRQIQNMAVGTSSSMVKINSRTIQQLAIPIVRTEEQTQIILVLRNAQSLLDEEQSLLAKLRLQKSGLMEDLLTGRVSVAGLLAPEGSAHGA